MTSKSDIEKIIPTATVRRVKKPGAHGPARFGWWARSPGGEEIFLGSTIATAVVAAIGLAKKGWCQVIDAAKPQVVAASKVAQQVANSLWQAGNDAGSGFDPELDGEAAQQVADLEGTDNVALVSKGGRLLAVAWLHGAWAVDVTGDPALT